jgi:hypothetical protein
VRGFIFYTYGQWHFSNPNPSSSIPSFNIQRSTLTPVFLKTLPLSPTLQSHTPHPSIPWRPLIRPPLLQHRRYRLKHSLMCIWMSVTVSGTSQTPIPLSLPKDAPIIPNPPITYPSLSLNTPEASHSASTSPALLVSPQTLPNVHLDVSHGQWHFSNPNPSSSVPSFTTRVSLPKDAPIIPNPPITYPSLPLNTPEASHSASTSPASLVLPQTLPNVHLDVSHGQWHYFSNPNPSSSVPSFTTRISLPKDAPIIPNPPITYPSLPLDTPEASHSASTSPASSVLPQTPPNAHGPGLVNGLSLPSSSSTLSHLLHSPSCSSTGTLISVHFKQAHVFSHPPSHTSPRTSRSFLLGCPTRIHHRYRQQGQR